MTPAQRCDEIIRMIDEVLEAALNAERGAKPTPSLIGSSFDQLFALPQLERRP
jgi:hypothetical protein